MLVIRINVSKRSRIRFPVRSPLVNLLFIPEKSVDKWFTGDGVLESNYGLLPNTHKFDIRANDVLFEVSLRGVIERKTPLTADQVEIMTHKIPSGVYNNPQSILDSMKHVLPVEMRKQFDFNLQREGNVNIRCSPGYAIQFPSNNTGLGEMLGFADDQLGVYLTERVDGKYNVDIKRGIYFLMVYTNLIYPERVVDFRAPLLRTIEPPHNTEQTTHVRVYEKVDYYPVRCRELEIIHI